MILATRPARLISLAALAHACIACGAEAGGEHTDVSGWQLVDGDYPYRGAHGETVCSKYQRPATEGPFGFDTHVEYYHFDVMNRHLDDARNGRFEHAPPALVAALSAKGIQRVETCDQAREFVRLTHEILESEPSVETAASDVGASPPSSAGDHTRFLEELRASLSEFHGEPPGGEYPFATAAPPGEDRVEKIADGHLDDALSGVKLLIFNSGTYCSGQVISHQALWTAAHCFPATGGFRVTVSARTGNVGCLMSGSCSADPGVDTVFVFRDPNYNGTAGTDRAMVFRGGGVPWNLAAGYHRIRWMTSGLSVGARTILTGFGVNTSGGGGGQTERVANGINNIDFVGSHHFVNDAAPVVGRNCKGDSGGIPINDNLTPFLQSAGVWANFEMWPGDQCPSPTQGFKMRYARHFADWADVHFFFTGQGCFPTVFGTVTWFQCWN